MLDSLFRNMTPVVKNLLIINVLVFFAIHLLAWRGINVVNYLVMYHYSSEEFQPYQIVTSIFTHVGVFHIFANMLGLVSFGVALERFIGPKRFLFLYLVAGVAGNIVYQLFHMGELAIMGEDIFIKAGDYLNYSSNKYAVSKIISTAALGASGAVFGIFAAVYKFFPNTEVMLLFPPIPLKIKVLFAVLMIGSVVLSIYPVIMQGVAHMAHFGGGLAGLIIVYFWQKDKTRFY